MAYTLDEIDVMKHKVQSFTVKDGIIYVMDNSLSPEGASTFYIKRYNEVTGERLPDITFTSNNTKAVGAEFYITKDSQDNLVAVADLTSANKNSGDSRIIFIYSVTPSGGTYAGKARKLSDSTNNKKWEMIGLPAVEGDVAGGTFRLIFPVFCSDGKVAVETMEYDNGDFSGTSVIFTAYRDCDPIHASLRCMDNENIVYSDPVSSTCLYTKSGNKWNATGSLDNSIDGDIKLNANGFVPFSFDGEKFAVYGKESSFDKNIFGIAACGGLSTPNEIPASRATSDDNAFSDFTPLTTLRYPNNDPDFALNMNLAEVTDGDDGEKNIYIYVPNHALEKYVMKSESGSQTNSISKISADDDKFSIITDASTVTVSAGASDVTVYTSSGAVAFTVLRHQTVSSQRIAPGLYIAVSATQARKFLVR